MHLATYLGEVSQYFWHLVTTLPAAYVDDDVTVGVLGQGLRDDSLSTTEGSGDGCGSSLHTSSRKKRGESQEVTPVQKKCCWVEYFQETYGKSASSTLCPVSSGWLAGSFSVTGRTCLTGHTWTIVNFSFTPSNSSSITTSWNRHTRPQHKATSNRYFSCSWRPGALTLTS